MFWDFHPRVLNAMVNPMAVSPLLIELRIVASMPAVFSAVTVTSPVVVSTSLAVIQARASARTTLVAIWPPAATTVPLPHMLPPEADRVMSPSACIHAFSRAVTVTEAALTSAFAMWASVAARRSFITTRMPTARAFESVKLPRLGYQLSMGAPVENFFHTEFGSSRMFT